MCAPLPMRGNRQETNRSCNWASRGRQAATYFVALIACTFSFTCAHERVLTCPLASSHLGARDHDSLFVELADHRVYQREMVQLLRDHAGRLFRLGLLVHDGAVLSPL